MSHRKIEHLNDNRIIYRRLPVSDKPSHSFDWGYFYEDGTYEFYDLFRSKALINTYKSLRWHLRVIWHLNPQLNLEEFSKLSTFIANKDNGFTTFTMQPDKLKNIIRDIDKTDLEEPPNNKLRKIIFKDYTMLSMAEKLKIVGKLIGKQSNIDSEQIYDSMLLLNHEGHKITIKSLANILNCSVRTVHRKMNEQLKQEKNTLNEKI
jgi:AraC-like DNA-binding protein